MTILSLHHYPLTYIANNLPTHLLLLDISSEFYIINLDLLIYRLKLTGLEDIVLLWFSNYITNTIYSTKINKSLLPKRKVIFGLHQGSFISPIHLLYLPTPPYQTY